MHRMTILYRTDARPSQGKVLHAATRSSPARCRCRCRCRGMSWLTYWRPYDLAMLSNVVQCRPFKRCPKMFPSGFPLERFASKFSNFFFLGISRMWPQVGRHSISHDFLPGSTIPSLTLAVCTPAGRGHNDQRAQPQHPWYVLS